jgi:hypothetical protein
LVELEVDVDDEDLVEVHAFAASWKSQNYVLGINSLAQVWVRFAKHSLGLYFISILLLVRLIAFSLPESADEFRSASFVDSAASYQRRFSPSALYTLFGLLKQQWDCHARSSVCAS